MNQSTKVIMYDDRSNTTDHIIQCTINVALFLRCFGTLIVSLGLIGNLLSILVFSRKALRSRSCSNYLLALSLSDVHVLLGYTFENLLYHGYGIQVLSNAFMCKTTIFLIYASTDISNYLLTLAAIDRCLLISNSTSRYRFCRKSMAKYLIIAVVFLFSAINSHILFGFNVDQMGACLPISKRYIYFYVHHYDSYIDIIKTVLIPFTSIFICNSFIIFKLTQQRTSLRRHVGSVRRKHGHRRRREKDRQLTWFLLFSSILFIFLSLPSEINDFIRTHLKSEFQMAYACQLWASTSLLILIQQSNHASHFYLYTLTGPIFRKEFHKLICLRRKASNSNAKELVSHTKQPSITFRCTPPDAQDDGRTISTMKPSNSLCVPSMKSDV